MFWGLIMEPKRRYTQTVKRPFHVSMAALDIFSSDNEPCQVMLNFEDRNYLLCTLQKDKDVQCMVDLNFEVGNKVIFATNGNSNVHLTGYLVEDEPVEFSDEEEEVSDEIAIGSKKRKTRKIENQPPQKKSKTLQLLEEADNYDSNDDESFSLKMLEEEEESDEYNESDEEDMDMMEDLEMADEDDEDEEDDDSGDEDEEESSSSDAEEKETKSKVNGVDSKRKQRKAKLAALKATESPLKATKGDKTPNKLDKSPKGENHILNKSPKGDKTPKEQQAASPQKRSLEGGIIIQDIVVGEGQAAKPGKLAEVYYEGRLKQNNKVFDKLRQGTGFKFRLGKQEVIKGWDVGVVGMKIGGKRRIICPPNMAYGSKGSPPQIPPNSTLVFVVELKNIK